MEAVVPAGSWAFISRQAKAPARALKKDFRLPSRSFDFSNKTAPMPPEIRWEIPKVERALSLMSMGPTT